MIRHIFVDWNGTQIDDMREAYSATCNVTRHCNLPTIGHDAFVQHIIECNGDWIVCFQRLGVSLTAADIRKLYIPAYLKHSETIAPAQGVRETLHALRSKGVRIHLLTAAHAALVEQVSRSIQTFHHETHFGVHDKAAHMQRIMLARGIRPDEVAHVGDLPSDVSAAVRAEVHGIGLRTVHVPEKAFARVRGPWYFAHNWREVCKYIGSINGWTPHR